MKLNPDILLEAVSSNTSYTGGRSVGLAWTGRSETFPGDTRGRSGGSSVSHGHFTPLFLSQGCLAVLLGRNSKRKQTVVDL